MSVFTWNSAHAVRWLLAAVVCAAVSRRRRVRRRRRRGRVPRLPRPRRLCRARGRHGRALGHRRRKIRRVDARRPRLPRMPRRHRVDPPRRAPRCRLRPALPRAEPPAAGSSPTRGSTGSTPPAPTAARGRARSAASSATRRPSGGKAVERDKLEEARQCAACHKGNPMVAAWFSDRHFLALAGGNRRAPSCPDCHSSHRVRPAAAPESTVNRQHLAETCANGARGTERKGACHGALGEAGVAGASMNPLPRGRRGRTRSHSC